MSTLIKNSHSNLRASLCNKFKNVLIEYSSLHVDLKLLIFFVLVRLIFRLVLYSCDFWQRPVSLQGAEVARKPTIPVCRLKSSK